MDPNTALNEMVELATKIDDAQDTTLSQALGLAERVLALHEWISNGGFFPKTWDPNQEEG